MASSNGAGLPPLSPPWDPAVVAGFCRREVAFEERWRRLAQALHSVGGTALEMEAIADTIVGEEPVAQLQQEVLEHFWLHVDWNAVAEILLAERREIAAFNERRMTL